MSYTPVQYIGFTITQQQNSPLESYQWKQKHKIMRSKVLFLPSFLITARTLHTDSNASIRLGISCMHALMHLSAIVRFIM